MSRNAIQYLVFELKMIWNIKIRAFVNLYNCGKSMIISFPDGYVEHVDYDQK